MVIIILLMEPLYYIYERNEKYSLGYRYLLLGYVINPYFRPFYF